jgi:hypothetical protein
VLASYITTLGGGPVLLMVVRTAMFAGFIVPVSHWSQWRKLFVLRVVQMVKIICVRVGTLHLGNLNPREWRYLTPEVGTLLKGKSDSKTTRKTSAPVAWFCRGQYKEEKILARREHYRMRAWCLGARR